MLQTTTKVMLIVKLLIFALNHQLDERNGTAISIHE